MLFVRRERQGLYRLVGAEEGDTRIQMPWRDGSGARVRRQGQGGGNSTANKLVVFFKTKTRYAYEADWCAAFGI